MILLSFSTNIARGPFQGYVPDLVAEPQVGLASGLVGMMQIVGNVTGFLLVSLAVSFGDMSLAAVAVAIVELVDDAERRAAGREGAAAEAAAGQVVAPDRP